MASSSNMQYAAILARNELTNESLKPTIFDVIAQENMNQLLRLSFSHLFEWAAKYSARLGRLKKYKSELYLTLHSSLEFVYLRAYDALLSEHFYGMQRVELSNAKRVLSILLSIVVPYLKAKLDDVYEELERAVDEGTEHLSPNNRFLNARLTLRLKSLMLKYYPYFHLLWSSAFWLFRFLFTIGKSPFSSPLLRLLNLRLVYNLTSQEKSSMFGKLTSTLNYLFTCVLFFLQFLQWHNAYNEQAAYSVDVHPLRGLITKLKANQKSEEDGDESSTIRAPKLPEKLANSNTFKRVAEKNLCPICSNKRRNESVLTVSGLAFCYICIFKFVKEHKRCPLTGYPCDVQHIIRIYSTADS